MITAIFIIELAIKVIVYGLIFNGKQSYLRLGWNILDMFIVCSSILGLLYEYSFDNSTQHMELFKMLRILRSLRMISKNEGLKLSVTSLVYSLPGILNVTLVSALCLFLLGIFFLNLLRG